MSKEIVNVPRHVAVVMDGNGRWARERGLPRIRGHEEGANSVAAVAEACVEAGVEWLTLFAFSMENWRRPRSEIESLMALLSRFLDTKTAEMGRRGVRLHAIGDLARLPDGCRKALDRAIRETAANGRLNLVLALSYGARQEIVRAVRRLAREVAAGELAADAITEEALSVRLDTGGMPDPDLLLRTSGEMRLSNFLLWQLSYTELFISQKLWPDFRKDDMLDVIREYGRRQRRFGGV